MKKWAVIWLLLLAMVLSGQSTQEKRPSYVEGEVVVKLTAPVATQGFATFAQGFNLTVGRQLRVEGMAVLRAEGSRDLEQLCEGLRQDPAVAYAEPNYLYYASETPNDPRFNELWGMHNTGQTGGASDADIDAVEAWDVQKGSSDVLVAVIDTGVDYNHEDLADNIWTNPGETGTDADGNDKRTNGQDDDGNGYVDDWHGWDFANNDNDPMDDNGHGTHVSGTIGAEGNNNIGVVGVNWTVKIMPLKFLGANGSGSLAAAIEAIQYGATLGARVMNNSWGGGGRSQALEDAITIANSAGALFVAAAGNAGTDNDASPNYPSNYDVPNVLAVAAIDHSGKLANFGPGGGGGMCGCDALPSPGSNFGATTVDLAAPGKDILSTTPGNTYKKFSGTSMATPHVTGVAALVLAQFPTMSVTELKNRLMSSVDVSSDLQGKIVTGGKINAFKAVSGPVATTAKQVQ